MMRATTLGRPAVAALMAALGLVMVITFVLWLAANFSPHVNASNPAANLGSNNPAMIAPPPTITPLRIGALPTVTPVSLAPQPPAAPTPTIHQNVNSDGDNNGSNDKGKGKGHKKP